MEQNLGRIIVLFFCFTIYTTKRVSGFNKTKIQEKPDEASRNATTEMNSSHNTSFQHAIFGSFLETWNSSYDVTKSMPELKRIKRQFSSTVATNEIGMFGKIVSISYHVLQKAFEFWFFNLFEKNKTTAQADIPTHPFHARSARKIGHFTQKLVNATYKRIDIEDVE